MKAMMDTKYGNIVRLSAVNMARFNNAINSVKYLRYIPLVYQIGMRAI